MIDPATRERAVEMYASGQTAEHVAAEMGVGKSSVLTWAKRAGVPIRQRHTYDDPQTVESEPVFTGRWVRDGLVMRPVAS